jgi:hypothetical protein
MRLLLLLPLTLCVASCAPPPRPDGRAEFIDLWCRSHAPIHLSDQEIGALSDADLRANVAQNRTGERLCGWRAPPPQA